jgi:hypothetical protein
LLLSKDLDAGRDQEFHKNDRRSHTSALGELFIADEWKKVQEEILKRRECEIWFGRDDANNFSSSR